jgi:L-2-hydroxyglutarate oxidase
VAEKESEVARHQSGRNSGVVHAGLYYRPGSLKARLCVAGKAELERFIGERGIPYRRCGKLVVAVRPREVPRLAALLTRARKNGVRDVEEVPGDRIPDLEPHGAGIRALHSPGTGIVDFRRVAEALGDDVWTRGGEVLTGCEVVRITGGRVRTVVTSRGDLHARAIVACAGLQADRLVSASHDRRGIRVVPFRGSYLRLEPTAAALVRGLIYPVPDPNLPFLGVHFTRRIDGQVWVGPNAMVALSREGYRAGRVSGRDLRDLLAFPGFWRLATRHLGAALEELVRELVPGTFVRELRRYVPEVKADDLSPGPSGIRAQAVDRRGRLIDDFVVSSSDGVVHVLSAPSPAATACLAIGRLIAARVERSVDLG